MTTFLNVFADMRLACKNTRASASSRFEGDNKLKSKFTLLVQDTSSKHLQK